jgi:ribosomal-protein-serine acetyltransferase
MFTLLADEDLRVGLLQSSHAEPLFTLMEQNRERLEPRIPFLDSQRSVEDVRRFIHAGLERFGAERGFSAGIWLRGELTGWIGMRVHEDGYGTLGYWIDGRHEGKGLATRAVSVAVAYAFEILGLPRIEIRCEPDNAPSIGVAERCGFVREGLLHDAIRICGNARDLVLYARLATPRTSPTSQSAPGRTGA